MINDTLVLSQWLSPAYPVGAFAYSHGLEAAIASGAIASAEDLQDWLTDLIHHGSIRNDAILLQAAYRADDEAGLSALNDIALAFAASSERQLEMTAQGAAFHKVTAEIWHGGADAFVYPVAVGAAATRQALDLELTTTLFCHSIIANLVSAAQRLMGLGQTRAQAMIASLAAPSAEVAQQALDLTVDGMSSSTFAFDIAAMHHETLQPRIFRT